MYRSAGAQRPEEDMGFSQAGVTCELHGVGTRKQTKALYKSNMWSQAQIGLNLIYLNLVILPYFLFYSL